MTCYELLQLTQLSGNLIAKRKKWLRHWVRCMHTAQTYLTATYQKLDAKLDATSIVIAGERTRTIVLICWQCICSAVSTIRIHAKVRTNANSHVCIHTCMDKYIHESTTYDWFVASFFGGVLRVDTDFRLWIIDWRRLFFTFAELESLFERFLEAKLGA